MQLQETLKKYYELYSDINNKLRKYCEQYSDSSGAPLSVLPPASLVDISPRCI